MSDLGLRTTLNLLLSPNRDLPALFPPTTKLQFFHSEIVDRVLSFTSTPYFLFGLNLFFASPSLLPLHPVPLLFFSTSHSNTQSLFSHYLFILFSSLTLVSFFFSFLQHPDHGLSGLLMSPSASHPLQFFFSLSG